jgi:hypothetical protein
MVRKSEYLQIRVSRQQKAALKRLASHAAQDVSSYVLARALPAAQQRFQDLLALLGEEPGAEHRYILAELNELLSGLARDELRAAIAHADVGGLSPLLRNYVAAMVEQACYFKRVPPPAWTAGIAPLEKPHFATRLKSLRLHLLRASPVPFKRRNIFVDAGVGARV